MKMNNERIFRIPLRPFTIYWSKSFTQESHPGGSRSSISWLTGYSIPEIREKCLQQVDYRTFWENAPIINPMPPR